MTTPSLITVALAAAITAHGESVTELSFRPPTVKDIIELGQPVLLIPSADGNAGIEVRPSVIAKYISRLAGINPRAVESLSVADFRRAQGVIMGFFGGGPDEEAEEGIPTTPATPST